MKDRITENIEKVLDIKPIDDDNTDVKLPPLDTDSTNLGYDNLSADIEAYYTLLNKAMDIQKQALDEMYLCDKQEDKSSLLSTANSALSSSLNALDKATKLKLHIIKNTPKDDDDDSDYIAADRDSILEIVNQKKKKKS